MCTAHLLTVSRSIRKGGGVCPGVSAWGFVCPEVCLPKGAVCPGGVSTQGECLLGGGCLPREGGLCPEGVYPSMQWGRHPFPVNRITDRCKNITLPQTSFAGTSTNIYFHFKLPTENCWLQNRKLTCSIVFKGTYGHMFLHVKNISLRLNSHPHQTFFLILSHWRQPNPLSPGEIIFN